MRKDAQGYYYFIDRIGDTYRWKGENVATSQVSEALTGFDGLREANIYGVKVPGMDGRAGMALLSVDSLDTFDFTGFYQHLTTRLPEFARPIFLRFCAEIDVTGTFKHRKVDLVKQGFDLSQVQDPLYMADTAARTFVPLTAVRYQSICAGELRL